MAYRIIRGRRDYRIASLLTVAEADEWLTATQVAQRMDKEGAGFRTRKGNPPPVGPVYTALRSLARDGIIDSESMGRKGTYYRTWR